MHVVYLTTLVSIVTLLPCIIGEWQCPAADIMGCWCSSKVINCQKGYIGEGIPEFSDSNHVYFKVSYI